MTMKECKMVISMILGRMHVMTPDREMLREVISRAGVKQWRKTERADRRELLNHAMKVHRHNRDIFIKIQTGRI